MLRTGDRERNADDFRTKKTSNNVVIKCKNNKGHWIKN